MASDSCRKDASLEENRMDSGIDSYRSILKSVEPRETIADAAEPGDEFSTAEEDLDSSYGSSSITIESLSEIVGGCTISSAAEEPAQSSELSEQEENLLTTITEDGDTWALLYFIAIFLHMQAWEVHSCIEMKPKPVKFWHVPLAFGVTFIYLSKVIEIFGFLFTLKSLEPWSGISNCLSQLISCLVDGTRKKKQNKTHTKKPP